VTEEDIYSHHEVLMKNGSSKETIWRGQRKHHFPKNELLLIPMILRFYKTWIFASFDSLMFLKCERCRIQSGFLVQWLLWWFVGFYHSWFRTMGREKIDRWMNVPKKETVR